MLAENAGLVCDWEGERNRIHVQIPAGPKLGLLGFELHILMLSDSLTPKWGHSRGAAHELRTAALCGGQVQLEERVRENQSEFG